MINFCSFFSGSSGNCIFVSDQKTNILIDVGVSGKTVEASLKSIGQCPSKISAIMVTHEHSDHTKGIGILSRKYNIPVYANKKTWNVMKSTVGEIDPENIRTFETNKTFTVGDMGVKAFNIPHDAVEPVGYNFFM